MGRDRLDRSPAPAGAARAAGVPAAAAPGQGRYCTKVVALAAVGAVLVAGAVTGGVLLLGKDGDGGQETRTATTSPTSDADGNDSPSPTKPATASPTGDPSVVVDDLNGITFPIPDGWEDGDRSGEEDAVLVTDGTFDCPGEGGVCRGGVVVSRTVTGSDETSPKTLAENDIEDAANDAFDRDVLDRQPYDGITGHEVVGSGSVAVAGRAGLLRALARHDRGRTRRLRPVPRLPVRPRLRGPGPRPVRRRRGRRRSAGRGHRRDRRGHPAGGRRGRGRGYGRGVGSSLGPS